MRSLWLSVLFALALPSIGYSWTIEKTYQDPKFPGTVTVAVDPLGLLLNQVDVLFVVDNSGSMSAHQENLARNIDALIAPWLAADLDLHAGVISTDMEGFAIPSGGHLANGFVTSTTPDLAKELAKRITLGVNGSGTERHLDAIKAALTSPVIDNENAGFLRPSAALAVIFLTDAEDQSQATADELIQLLKSLKGGDMNLLKMGALYIPSSINDSKCSRDGFEKPVKLETVLTAFNSINVGLCDAAFKDGVEKMGLGLRPTVSGEPIRSVQLPSAPVFQSIAVTYGGDPLKAGHAGIGWYYDPSTVSVHIGPDYDFLAKPRGTLLEIRYKPVDWQ